MLFRSQDSANRKELTVWQALGEISVLREMLAAEIGLQFLPALRRVAQSREESCLEPTNGVCRGKQIPVELLWVDDGLIGVRQSHVPSVCRQLDDRLDPELRFAVRMLNVNMCRRSSREKK